MNCVSKTEVGGSNSGFSKLVSRLMVRQKARCHEFWGWNLTLHYLSLTV